MNIRPRGDEVMVKVERPKESEIILSPGNTGFKTVVAKVCGVGNRVADVKRGDVVIIPASVDAIPEQGAYFFLKGEVILGKIEEDDGEGPCQ